MAAAISTIGACGFLLGCRLWLLVELGMMLCSNAAMALIFSTVSLLAILSIVGPLPFENNKHLHQGDFRAILSGSCFRRRDNRERDAAEIGMPAEDLPPIKETERQCCMLENGGVKIMMEDSFEDS